MNTSLRKYWWRLLDKLQGHVLLSKRERMTTAVVNCLFQYNDRPLSEENLRAIVFNALTASIYEEMK